MRESAFVGSLFLCQTCTKTCAKLVFTCKRLYNTKLRENFRKNGIKLYYLCTRKHDEARKWFSSG